MARTSVLRLATTSSAPTHAAAMLVKPSVLMDVAVMTLMSVRWVLTSVPRIAVTPLALTPVVVGSDIDLMPMVAVVMVCR